MRLRFLHSDIHRNTHIGFSEEVVTMAFQFDLQWESIFDANKAYYHNIVIKEFTGNNIARFFRIGILFDVFYIATKICFNSCYIN